MLLRETMGIGSDGTCKAFKRADVEAFLARLPDGWGVDPVHPERTVRHAFVAIAPSGGGASAFAIASIIVLYTGAVQARAPPPAQSPGRGAQVVGVEKEEGC